MEAASASGAANAAATSKSYKALSDRIDVRSFVMIGALIAIWITFTVFTDGSFIEVRNISNLVRQMSIVGVLGTGMVLVIVSGNIDLSVGSALGALSGIAAALHIWGGLDPFLTMAIVLVLGMCIGLFQGAIVAYLRVPAFIVTLGGLLFFRGVVLGVTKGISIAPFAAVYRALGQSYVPNAAGWALGALMCAALIVLRVRNRFSRRKYGMRVETIPTFLLRAGVLCALVLGAVAVLNAYDGIPVPTLVMLSLVVIFSFIAVNTVFGRSIYAMGGNVQATRYSGINVKRNLAFVFMLNGLLAGIAAILYSARLNAATPTAGQNMELDAIAAAVIGGASMSGGSGKVTGAILGALFMASIDNGMSMMNMDAYWQYCVKGVILVSAVWFDIAFKK